MSMSLQGRIKRLIQKLHRVFDKDPGATLAFRLRAITGTLTWQVSDGRFRIIRNGFLALDMALEGATIADLLDAVERLPDVRAETTRARGYYETRPVAVTAVTMLDASQVEQRGLPPGWNFTRPGIAR
jgi:hypothetical protein